MLVCVHSMCKSWQLTAASKHVYVCVLHRHSDSFESFLFYVLSLCPFPSLLVNTWRADSLVGRALTASKRAASSVQSTPWQSRLRWYVCSFTAQDCTKTMCTMSLWPRRVCYRFFEFTPTAQMDKLVMQTDRIAYCHHLHYMNRFYIRYLHVYLYLLAVCFRENVSSHIKGLEKHDPK